MALVCDDRLFLKPTPPGRAMLAGAEEAPPYPGAKPHLVIPEDDWAEPAHLARLFHSTAEALPEPRRKTG